MIKRWWCSTDARGPGSAAFTKFTPNLFLPSSCQNARWDSHCDWICGCILAILSALAQVWSLSEDQTLVIYDRAAGKKMKKVLANTWILWSPICCVQVPLPGSHFPICMSGQGNCLWIGDKGGNLHLVDTTDDAFEVKNLSWVFNENTKSGDWDCQQRAQRQSDLNTCRPWQSGNFSAINLVRCKILISKVTASSDGDIRVLQPTRKPTLINLLKV